MNWKVINSFGQIFRVAYNADKDKVAIQYRTTSLFLGIIPIHRWVDCDGLYPYTSEGIVEALGVAKEAYQTYIINEYIALEPFSYRNLAWIVNFCNRNKIFVPLDENLQVSIVDLIDYLKKGIKGKMFFYEPYNFTYDSLKNFLKEYTEALFDGFSNSSENRFCHPKYIYHNGQFKVLACNEEGELFYYTTQEITTYTNPKHDGNNQDRQAFSS